MPRRSLDPQEGAGPRAMPGVLVTDDEKPAFDFFARRLVPKSRRLPPQTPACVISNKLDERERQRKTLDDLRSARLK